MLFPKPTLTLNNNNGEQTMTNILSETNAINPIPEKFRDPQTGELRADVLLKSYLELEKKLGRMVDPSDSTRMNSLLGVPEKHSDYCINCDHGLFAPDDEVNTRLHAAGFKPDQAQLVYDLAAERLVPMILEVANEYQSEREQERLVAEFGGQERWQEIARQIQTWASTNLPPQAVKGLSTTYDGIMALYRMMQDSSSAGEMPVDAGGASGPSALSGADDLAAMMRDPRYWKQKDPNYVAKVTSAFERRYRG